MTAKTATKKQTSRKVGQKPQQQQQPKGEQTEQTEQKQKKPEFDLNSAVDADGEPIALDDDGCLTAVPTNWTREFRPLGRNAFANRVLHLEHKLHLFDEESERRAERRAELVDNIEEAKNGPSPEKRKMKKAQRLAKQLEALKAELAEQGIDLD